MKKKFALLCIHTNNITETEKLSCEILGFKKKFEFFKDWDTYSVTTVYRREFTGENCMVDW